MKFQKIIIGSLLFSQFAGAAPNEALKIDLAKELQKLSARNLYDLDPKTQESSLAILSRMKYFEIKKRWKECGALGAKVIAGEKDIQGWVASSWLRCEIKSAETSKDKKALRKPVDWVQKHKVLLNEGPWRSQLSPDYVSASMTLLEQNRTAARVNQLLEEGDLFTKDARANLLFYAGEFAEKEKDLRKALHFYEQSLQLRDNKQTRDRFDAVKNTLGLKFNITASGIDGVLENEGAEASLEEKMNKSLKAGDTIGALKTAVVIQTEYAGSKVARRLRDKPLEIYLQLFEGRPRDEKDVKGFGEIEKVDPVRRAEWAQILHRRASYDQALIFSESALKELHRTQQATSLYWIAGRSAHFVGQYERALLHFSKLIEFHSGTDEAAEAMLRSGLVNLRLKNFSTAKTHFEKLISQKKDRYDLIARYWLVRSLENQDGEKERAVAAAKEIIERYPYSYYGLRLTAESNKGEYVWPNATSVIPAKSGEMWLIGDQKAAWKRFKALTKAGWLLEAQSEVQNLPVVKNPWLEYHYAKFMAKSFQFPVAIRWMGEAMDLEGTLRSPETLSALYPKTFGTWIDAEAKKYNLNSILIRSLIRQESAFGIRAQSSANAQGLMQLIPGTAQDVARRLGMKKLEFPEDVFRPEINIPLGTTYISMMIDQFSGSVPFALGAYNAGPTKMKIFIEAREEIKELVAKPSSDPMDEIWFDELPWSETSFYIKAILRNTLLYKLIDKAKVDWSLVLWQDLHNKKAIIK